MVTNDLGACEWFVWDLRRSGLIDRGQLDSIVSEFLKRNPRAEAPALAEYLVGQGTLTAFQAERILNGKTQGLVLGPYILLDAIGQGSMGQVYKAVSKNDNQQYAVKVLPRRSMWNVRLARRQVRSFSQFSHPAVIPFVDVGTAGGLHYLVWPLAEGQTLEYLIQQNGKMSPEQTALIGVQVAQGLNVCHQNSIFHGLVKPSNVMIGSDQQARILDFGIGSLLAENEGESLVDTMSTANTLTSGLDCASPESIMEPTNRTPAGDQYSLGCVMYVCLTGHAPFPEGSAVEKMMAHQTKEPTSVKVFCPECPDGLAAVIAKLMAKKPEDRYGSTDEIVEELEPFLGQMAAVAASAAAAATRAGSNHRMPGLGTNRMGGSNNHQALSPAAASAAAPGRPAAQPTTPVPSRSAPAASTPNNALPARGGNVSLPSRASFQLGGAPHAAHAAGDAEIELTSALQDPNDYRPGPAALRASAGWVTDAANESEDRPARGSSGVFLIVVIAVALMGAAFFGAKLLMK
jgi:serine/threonine-protein kinase